MEIKKIVVGELETNCYILEKNNELLIIDPGAEFPKIKDYIGNKKVVGCLLTHTHFDHVGALEDVLNEYKLKVNEYNGSTFKYKIISTKGHTDDSVTYYFEEDNIMFTGDFLFYHSIGRTDLGGNDIDMINSLNMIKEFDDSIKIFPGHGPETILGNEKKYFSYYY